MNGDEVDLRPYIVVLLKNKWWIIAAGLLFAITALVVTLVTPRNYTANATLLLTRSRAMLSLADQFPTVIEPVDSRSRMDALMAIAKDDSIANMTLQSLGDALPEEYRSIDYIKAIVSLLNNGDSITISATTTSPGLSAKIANTWADHLIEIINIAYSGEQPLSKIQERLEAAQAEYSQAQTALEEFIRNNSKTELETRLHEANSLISSYGSERASQMVYYLSRKQAMEELGQQAAALKRQLEQGNRSLAGNIGDALAVTLARMDAILSKSVNVPDTGTSSGSVFPQQNATINLQVDGDFPVNGSAGYTADIDAIIQLAEEEKTKTEENIQALIEESASPDPDRVDQIAATAAEIQSMQQQIEAAAATEKELTSQRDLAWEAYQALAQKETEIKNATLTSNQVTLASQAIVPAKPDPRGAAQNTVIAGIVGVILAVIAVVGMFWWKKFNAPDPTK